MKLFITLMISSIALLSLNACSLKVKPEDSCNFVRNSLQQRVSWNSSLPINIYIHESFSNEKQAVPALTAAIKTWETALGKHLFTVAGVIGGSPTPSRDGVSIFYYMNTWEADRPSEQARTTIYWKGDQIVEGDIRINDKNFDFFSGDTIAASSVDLESLFLHELGHLLGLAHNDVAGSVMAERLASGYKRRDANSADLASLKCEY